MGFGEVCALIMVLAIFIIGYKNKKSSKETIAREDPNTARIRQMKEWDRFDDSKSGRS